MTRSNYQPMLRLAREAAEAAGGLIRSNFGGDLQVSESHAHDVKIELDRRSQDLIEGMILSRYPDHAIYGEEGIHGDSSSEYQWIVDPIDGTVNFFYGIPHFAVSIALRRAGELILGVIFDPMRGEMWSVIKGEPALLNGHPIRVSPRKEISEAIISVGFAKSSESIDKGLPVFGRLVHSVKKCRMMGSAALDIAYVATGRLDAYIENQISLWDVAAGILLVEAAGGTVELRPLENHPDKFSIVATGSGIDFGL